MTGNANKILVTNGGSSSIKFAVYDIGAALTLELNGQIDRIGDYNSTFKIHFSDERAVVSQKIDRSSFHQSTLKLLEYLSKYIRFDEIKAIGHRIVFGGYHQQPTIIDNKLMQELKSWMTYDEEHLPSEIKVIEILQRHFPHLLQYACFDTSFHAHLPRLAQLYALPIDYYEKGIKRYGFHGISYSYLMRQVQKLNPALAKEGKIILAHLGNGASIAAIRQGECIDTSMGFTPTAGLTMGTRCGDIDPGILLYLLHQEKLSPRKVRGLINHKSGLWGLSGISSDMRTLLEAESTEEKARDAVALFCYNLLKYIGSYIAVLGGVDALVFSGGIGENAPRIRERICRQLAFYGCDIDPSHNDSNALVISTKASKCMVYVIPTDEEIIIAESALQLDPAISQKQ